MAPHARLLAAKQNGCIDGCCRVFELYLLSCIFGLCNFLNDHPLQSVKLTILIIQEEKKSDDSSRPVNITKDAVDRIRKTVDKYLAPVLK